MNLYTSPGPNKERPLLSILLLILLPKAGEWDPDGEWKDRGVARSGWGDSGVPSKCVGHAYVWWLRVGDPRDLPSQGLTP